MNTTQKMEKRKKNLKSTTLTNPSDVKSDLRIGGLRRTRQEARRKKLFTS
jgi:hypothetical protein